MNTRHPRRTQTARGKEATARVLFSLGDTEYLVVWRLSRGPYGLERYLVRPRTSLGVGELLEAAVLPGGAPELARNRLQHQVWLASRLSHPAIGRVQGLYPHAGKLYLLAEHVEGCDLDTVLNLMVLREKRMTEAFCLHVASRVAEALHHAYTRTDEEGRPLGILHRAVSPGHVRMGLEGVVKLVDFVSAYSLLPGRLRTPEGLVPGEIEYAAPERLAPEGWADARSDLFSLGMVLLELLTGRSLYDLEAVEREALEGGGPRAQPARLRAEVDSWAPADEMAARAAALRPEHVEAAIKGVSAPVKKVLRKLLSPEPSERYVTAERLHAELLAGLKTVYPRAYGAMEAGLELRLAIAEAEMSPLRRELNLLERGVLSGDVPHARASLLVT